MIKCEQHSLESREAPTVWARFLGCTADEAELASFEFERAATFVQALLLFLAVRDWIRVAEHPDGTRTSLAAAMTIAFVCSLLDSRLRTACRLALACMLVKLVWIFPHNSNHFMVEFVCVAFVTSCDLEQPNERLLMLQSVRWLAVLALFWSGVQKVRYGTYFNGAFLASAIETRNFADVLGWFVSGQELSRIRHAVATRVPGEIRLTEPLAIALSNSIYVGEIAAAVALLVNRLRIAGVVLSLLLVAGIEWGARELMFGLLLTNILLLFVPRLWARWMLWANACVLAALMFSALGTIQIGEFN